ncbi:hypothetical protein GC163_23095 [bacterium]|nr:hypothetical protein [bacterium]
MSKSIEFTYEVQASGPIDIEKDVSQQVVRLLDRLSTDSRVRETAQKQGIDIDGFDALKRELAASSDKLIRNAPLIQVQPAGAGIEPGTVLVLVTIIPPVLEHFVGPVAVHIATSIWDEFILPELKSYFVKFKARSDTDQ